MPPCKGRLEEPTLGAFSCSLSTRCAVLAVMLSSFATTDQALAQQVPDAHRDRGLPARLTADEDAVLVGNDVEAKA